MGISWRDLDLVEQRNRIARTTLLARSSNFLLASEYVSGEGDNPRAFVIGEAPGAQEQAQGRPFVGPAGMVLRDLMVIAGLASYKTGPIGNRTEPNCWLTNTIKFRPRGNHTPAWFEIQAFRELLREEWVAVGSPRLIIPVGAVALTAVFGKGHGLSILEIAGKYINAVSKADIPLTICPMIHPSFGLRNPEVRPMMERHWSALGEWLDRYHR